VVHEHHGIPGADRLPASALLNVAGDIASIAPFLGVSTPSGTPSVTYTVIQVTIGRATSPALTTTFANNIVPGRAFRFFNLSNVTISSPVNGWYDIPLQIPYSYTGGDLVLDVTTQVPSAIYFSSSVGGSTAPVPRLSATGLAPLSGAVSTSGGTKYRLGYNPINRLVASTTGNGVGDLTLSVQALVPNATEGFLLISTDASRPLGTGPLLGLWPDALTWQNRDGAARDRQSVPLPVQHRDSGSFPTSPCRSRPDRFRSSRDRRGTSGSPSSRPGSDTSDAHR
jgi:hypothetical protein